MRIAIVDDLSEERALLRDRLERQLCRRSIQADIFEFSSGEDFLSAEKRQPFDVTFMDIYMEGMTGTEAAKELRKTDTKCLLVFTTTSTDHALEGFRVRAMHYLVKPFTEEDIAALTDEIIARIPRPEKYIEIKTKESELRLPYCDIVCAEHFAHVIYIRTTAGKTLATRQSFKMFIAPFIDDSRFFVCGRGTVVNLEHVSDFKNDSFHMEDGSLVPVSRELVKNARQAFMEYLLQRGSKL